MMKGLYRFLEKHERLGGLVYFLERQVKRALFDCRECGVSHSVVV
mgnify:CR=1 FL=1